MMELGHSLSGAAPSVTAIVPTLADLSRRASLVRAIGSLRRATAEPLSILVVVNGVRFDPDTVSLLRGMPDVHVQQVELGSLPNAIEVGRALVSTPFFCFLDDDDEYLEGAIDQRLRALNADPILDFVVTNGYRNTGSDERLALGALEAVASDPLRALIKGNWLASCGGMFRSERVGAEIFREINPYTEWTWIAFRLACAGKRLAALEAPSFRIYETADSASKSENYRRASLPLLQRMLEYDLPLDVRRAIVTRVSDTLHTLSEHAREDGNLRAAWRLHLASLRSVHGLRYLPYTLRLLPGQVRTRMSQ